MMPEGLLAAIRRDLRLCAAIRLDDFVAELQKVLERSNRKFPLHLLEQVVYEAMRQDPERRLYLDTSGDVIRLTRTRAYNPEPKPVITKFKTKKVELVRYSKPPKPPKPPKLTPLEKAKLKRTPENFKPVCPEKEERLHDPYSLPNSLGVAGLPEPFDVIRNGTFNTCLTNSPDGRAHHPNATAKLNEIMGTFKHGIFS